MQRGNTSTLRGPGQALAEPKEPGQPPAPTVPGFALPHPGMTQTPRRTG